MINQTHRDSFGVVSDHSEQFKSKGHKIIQTINDFDFVYHSRALKEQRLLAEVSTFSPKFTVHRLRFLCTKKVSERSVRLLTQSGS